MTSKCIPLNFKPMINTMMLRKFELLYIERSLSISDRVSILRIFHEYDFKSSMSYKSTDVRIIEFQKLIFNDRTE